MLLTPSLSGHHLSTSRLRRRFGWPLLFSALACSSGPSTNNLEATGGATRTGGVSGTGGSQGGAGAAPNTGGSSSLGGLTGTGGQSGAGGAPSGDGGHATGGGSPTGSSGGGARSTGGRTGTAGSDGSPYRDIAFSGLTSAVELAPLRLAANGLYPAKVTIGSGGVDNLFSGALLASNAETQALRSSVQHTNLRIIFTICEGLYRIVAKKSAGIATLADLKGKSITTPNAGTSTDYYLYKMLKTANLTASDVKITGGMVGMGSLSTDAATIWEPGIQYVSNTLGSDAIEFQNDAQGKMVYRELFDLHASAESLADPMTRRSIVKFVRTLIDASDMINHDPNVVIPLMTGPTGESAANLAKSFKYERYAGTLVPDVLDVLEEEEIWRAKYDNRTARTRAQLAPLVDDSILKEAMALP